MKNWRTTILGLALGVLHLVNHGLAPKHILTAICFTALGIATPDRAAVERDRHNDFMGRIGS